MKPFAIALLALLVPVDALACSCIPPEPVPTAVESATRVFLGKVAQVEDRGTFQRVVRFDATEHFKGSPVDTIELVTAAHGAMCGYPFQAGLAYVVYAHGDEGDLRVSSCSRTTLAGSGSDLDELRAAD